MLLRRRPAWTELSRHLAFELAPEADDGGLPEAVEFHKSQVRARKVKQALWLDWGLGHGSGSGGHDLPFSAKFLIGAAIGSGNTALAAERAGADFLLAINAGRLRNMGGPRPPACCRSLAPGMRLTA